MAQALQDILEEIKSLEPLPQVALRVLSLSAREDVVPSELVAVIQTDAGVTAKVLKLCNSAYYGFRREIASLPEAGNLLGCSTLVNLVLTACAGRYFRDYGRGDARRARASWERSVSTAIASGLLARRQQGVDRNRAYTIGLLQNVGQLVLERFLPEQSSALQAAMAGGMERLQAERAVLGLDHAEIGARLAERWNFPELLVDTIRHHHAPREAAVDPLLTSIAHLAEIVSQRLQRAAVDDGRLYELQASALGVYGISREDFDALEETLRAEVERACELVALD